MKRTSVTIAPIARTKVLVAKNGTDASGIAMIIARTVVMVSDQVAAVSNDRRRDVEPLDGVSCIYKCAYALSNTLLVYL